MKSNEAGLPGSYNKLEWPGSHTSGYLLRRILYGMRRPLIKIPAFVRRFGWLMLDGVSESAENAGRAFSDIDVKERLLNRCL